MKLSEKIGYTLEHLLEIELTERGIDVTRNEKPANETIRSDITFSKSRRNFVIFITHTKTQGMTNRKFYRTFEELAQRRILFPGATCIEVSLSRDSIRVPSQYGLLFLQLFDASFDVIPPDLEQEFFTFVEALPGSITIEVVRNFLHELPEKVHLAVKNTVDRILLTRKKNNAAMLDYWNRELGISKGTRRYQNDEATSIKLGIKKLSLMQSPKVCLSDISEGSIRIGKDQVVDNDYLINIGLCRSVTKRLTGWDLVFDQDVVFAAKTLLKAGVKLDNDWHQKYLWSPGAKRLFADIVDRSGTKQRHATLMNSLCNIRSANELKDAFLRDFVNDEARCDLIDLAIRASKYSQNELSTSIQEDLQIVIKQRNPVWFVVAKDEDAESVVGNIERFLQSAARLVWERSNGHFNIVPWEEFYSARIGTYYSHRSVRTEHLLLDAYLEKFVHEKKKKRLSVLPRLVPRII